MTHKRNIDHVLKNHIRSASPEEVESDASRVLERLRSENAWDDLHALPDGEQPVRALRKHPWRSFFAVAAGVAVATVVVVTLRPGTPRSTPAGIEVVDRVGAPGSNGFGETVRTDKEGNRTLTLPDGSRVEMRSPSELRLEQAEDGIRIRLLAGGIIVSAAPQRKGHLYVQTRDMTVSVVGTVFLVNAEEKGSRVAVIQGEVSVELDAQQPTVSKKLLPGDQAATMSLLGAPLVSEEISWSQNARQHLALLQQSAVPASASRAGEARDAFEEASVRPVDPNATPGGGGRGGAGGGTPPYPCSSLAYTVDPEHFTLRTSLYATIALAYGRPCRTLTATNTLVGAPAWGNERFEIQAKIPAGTPAYTGRQFEEGKAPKLQLMLQSLLADRFKLALHRESKEMPVYLLAAGKDISRLTAPRSAGELQNLLGGDPSAKSAGSICGPDPNGRPSCRINVRKVTMAELVPLLVGTTLRPVLDRTGITEEFSFDLEYAPVNGRFESSAPSIFTALQEQLGLKLDASRDFVEVLVIDHVERPTEN